MRAVNIGVTLNSSTFRSGASDTTDAMSRAFVEIRRAAGLDAELSMINNRRAGTVVTSHQGLR